MYEELVKSLQSCPDAEYGCSRCKYKNSLGCREKLMSDAANAIEELSSAGSIYGKAWTLGYDAGRNENSPRWISVAERLPDCEKGSEIGNVEWVSHGMVCAGCFGRGGKWRDAYFRTWTDATEGIDAKDAECWRIVPLPEPPREDT